MSSNQYQRPDPDALLAQVQRQERRAARGRLRIYFGASAGVGKTYAMLSAGRKLQAEGQDVLVGVVETHGRSETAALLEGLPLLALSGAMTRSPLSSTEASAATGIQTLGLEQLRDPNAARGLLASAREMGGSMVAA